MSPRWQIDALEHILSLTRLKILVVDATTIQIVTRLTFKRYFLTLGSECQVVCSSKAYLH